MAKYHTILAVDDNPAILTALSLCLEGTFEKVVTLDNPDNILSTLQQEEVECIILDMNFSLGINTGQDGIFWLQAVKKRHPNIPIILLTAYADVNLAVRGLKNGAADFAVKPWDNDELIRKIKDAVDKSNEIIPLDKIEASQMQKAMDKAHGNLTQAAEMLGITRQTLYNKLKKG